VGDHDGGSSADKVFDSLLNKVLGFGVDRCRCLVENEDAGVFKNRSCDGETLTLTARKTDSALAEMTWLT
jgi:hypothetical protein